ncbi:hypothetical protein DFJ73DRAFT_213314 [Zopfochytrium polystomum]|nr:hypothetical protein DFJ73DRAFT_213314 [Zopfochytrium polystomum]
MLSKWGAGDNNRRGERSYGSRGRAGAPNSTRGRRGGSVAGFARRPNPSVEEAIMHEDGDTWNDRSGDGFSKVNNDDETGLDLQDDSTGALQQQDDLEELLGFPLLVEGPQRQGWMVNMTPARVRESDTATPRDAVDFYFLEEDGGSFKVRVLYEPYFYVGCKAGKEFEFEDYLRRNFSAYLLGVQRVQKEDLSLTNHLVGAKRTLLKLIFPNCQCLLTVRKVLLPAYLRNQAKASLDESADFFDDTVFKKSTAFSDPLDSVVDLREYDISFYVRTAIDCDFRVGIWYFVKANGPGRVSLEKNEAKVNRAEPVIIAFDIETTKLPLKFPDAGIDSIMMISYMIDGQGYLITNREIVSSDIEDFEYTPKPEYEGFFTVFNEKNERSLLRRFFDEIRSKKPTVFVTYNGDFFDWPFVHARAKMYGFDLTKEIGFSVSNGEYKARHAIHMDAFKWVKRDSYLPQGSQGLKAVTRYKLGYAPAELDPEDMTRFASEKPQVLAQYSVSDAVATYYLYMKYVHPFIFSLCNIIPMNPDDVLRRGSGTLCEHLLMVEAYRANVIMPNKHVEETGKLFEGHLLSSETYVGGHVEALEAGVFRSDLPVQFHLVPSAFQQLIDEVDKALQFSIIVEGKLKLEDVVNYDEVRDEITKQLAVLRDKPNVMARPRIYHLDVAAMYPNIILTNRLQPDAMVKPSDCASCDYYNGPDSECQRKMIWSWRGEYYPAKRSEYNMIRLQLEKETFPSKDDPTAQLGFHELRISEQNEKIRQRVEEYSKKVYSKKFVNKVINKESIVCQRENPFYVNTVRNFRDRRYMYKNLLKVQKKKVDKAVADGDIAAVAEEKKLVVVYDSLQLAHKCILNSFYGYVMRKGARWYSMEMAGIVCLTGAKIIQLARTRVEQIGRPLELDTDGIWCILPEMFPENFVIKLASGKSHFISYPCVMLNHLVHAEFTNHQYQDLVPSENNPEMLVYQTHSENSIFFEVDGPYRAMILPASTEEDKLLKKRYAVFNDDGSLAELKGFELKRRGELKLIKDFQHVLFDKFLEGSTTAECYDAVASLANQWLDILFSKGADLEDEELYELISENRSMSKSLQDYGVQKSTSITTARRLAEFLGDSMVKDKGLACKFIISEKPIGIPVSEKAVPVSIFHAEESVKRHFLRKWLRDSSMTSFNIRDIVDWKYYLERFGSVIQKLISIPAAMQGVPNPVGRVPLPDWLAKRLASNESKFRQNKIDSMFQRLAPGEIYQAPDQSDKTSSFEIDAMDEDLPVPQPIADVEELARASQPSPPPTVPSLDEDYGTWLAYQKKKWRAQRRQAKDNRGRNLPRPLSRGFGASSFFQRQSRSVLEQPWQILQIVGTDMPGTFNVWAVIEQAMYCVKLETPRVFYINTRKEAPLPTLAIECRKVKKHLPRSHTRLNLFELVLPESLFQERQDLFASVFTHQDTEGVYETKVPLLFRTLLALGCIATVSGNRAKTGRSLSSGFSLLDLNHASIKANPYLAEGDVKYFFLFQAGRGSRHVYGLFSSNLAVCEIAFVDRAKNTSAIPNLSRLYQDRRAERNDLDEPASQFMMPSQQAGGKSDLFTYPAAMDVGSSVFATEAEAISHVNSVLRRYLDQRFGPTMLVVQSSMSLSELQQRGAVAFKDFPMLTAPSHKRDSALPPVGWQSIAAKRTIGHFLNVNAWLHERIELARYSDIPVGNLEHDYPIFISDLQYARRLHAADYVLWFSYSNKPDLGGREEDDNMYELDDLVNPERNHPGTYFNVSVEIDIANLAFNTIVNAGHIQGVESIIGNTDGTLKFGEADEDDDEGDARLMVAKLTSVDEKSFNGKCFKIIRDMVHEWEHLSAARGDRFASLLLTHLYRWVTSTSSRMYDPALYIMIHGLMKRVYNQLLSEFQRLGSTPIYSSFTKLVLSTCKTTIPTSISYIRFAVESISQKPLFTKLHMEVHQFWDYLMWMDRFNHGGIPCDISGLIAPGGQGQQRNGEVIMGIDMKWNIMEYLPPIMQEEFKRVIGEFIFEFHKFKSERRKMVGNGEADASAAAAYATYLNAFISKRLKKQLLGLVERLVKRGRSDKGGFDFPVLPGSHLELSNPTLEFVKAVVAVLGLDSSVEREVRILRKDLLTLIGVKEFSDQAIFRNPCEPFRLSQIICDYCNLTRELDLTRDHDMTAPPPESVGEPSAPDGDRNNEDEMDDGPENSGDEDDDESFDETNGTVTADSLSRNRKRHGTESKSRYRRKSHNVSAPDDDSGDVPSRWTGSWLCIGCGAEYDRAMIEQTLVEMLLRTEASWQLQDLKCTRCKETKGENLSLHCRCSGTYATTLSRTDFVRKIRVFVHLAKYYKMELLSEVATSSLHRILLT